MSGGSSGTGVGVSSGKCGEVGGVGGPGLGPVSGGSSAGGGGLAVRTGSLGSNQRGGPSPLGDTAPSQQQHQRSRLATLSRWVNQSMDGRWQKKCFLSQQANLKSLPGVIFEALHSGCNITWRHYNKVITRTKIEQAKAHWRLRQEGAFVCCSAGCKKQRHFDAGNL